MMTQREKRVAWTAGTAHMLTHGYMTLLPAVLVVISSLEGLDFFTIGIIANVGYFLFGLGSIPAGMLSDRLGAKKMLSLGLFGMAASSALVGLSPNGWTFTISYGLLGLSASIYHPAGLSLIARHIEKRGRALGIHGIMGNVGLSLAPLFAGLTATVFGTWRAAYLSFGLLGLMAAVALYKLKIEGEEELSARDFGAFLKALPAPNSSGSVSLGEGENSQRSERTVFIPVALILLYAGSVLFGFIYRGAITFMPALFQSEVNYVAEAGQPALISGLVATLVLSAGMFGQWLGGNSSDWLKRPEAGHIAIFALVGGSLYFISRSAESPLIAISVLFSVALFAWQPLQNALIARYTSKRSHGLGYGVNFFLIMGMGSIATAVGGYVADDRGVDMVYYVLAVASLAALLVSIAVVVLRKYSIRFSFGLEREGA